MLLATDHSGGVAHVLQLLHHGLDPPRSNKQNAVGQPADQVLRELLPGQQLLGQDGVFGLHEADPAVQLNGDTCSRRAHKSSPQRHKGHKEENQESKDGGNDFMFHEPIYRFSYSSFFFFVSFVPL
jgi:hypothetical protein